ncbi:MAG: hypothetical protein H0T88_06870 [Lysobacter sp.]|nr:hypothetical protein [Lysobacter sp.]
MARTALLSGAPLALARAQLLAAAASIDFCVDEATQGLELSLDLAHLNGSERTALAGRIGAGLCDLYMDSLGYVWRDQASALISTRAPLADFLYEGGAVAGRGVALAEAKGSTQRRGIVGTQSVADAAYRRQVARYLGNSTPAGNVLHGYAVGLCAALGKPAYLCIAETGASTPMGPSGAGSDDDLQPGVGFRAVSLSTALGNYGVALWLSGFRSLGSRLRGLRTGEGSTPAIADELMEVIAQHRRGFVGGGTLGMDAPHEVGFVLRVEPLRALAGQLSDMPPSQRRPSMIELPVLRPRPDTSEDGEFIQFTDGLVVFQVSHEEAETMAVARPDAPSRRLKTSAEEIEQLLLDAERAKREAEAKEQQHYRAEF